METSTRMGIFLFLGLVVGAVIGRWWFNSVVIGPIIGGVLFLALAYGLDRLAKKKE